MVFGTHPAMTVFDWARIFGAPYWSDLQQSFLWVPGGGKLMFSLPFSSSGICVCGSTIFWEQPVVTVFFNWELVSSDFGRMFLTWRGAGFLGSGWRGRCFLCLLLFLAFVWVMVLGKHPVMDVFWLKVRELDFGEPFLSDVKQDCWVMGGEGGVFSACCFFCYLCLWVDSFEYPLPCGHGGGMCSCGSQISLT